MKIEINQRKISFADGFDMFLKNKIREGCRPATIKHYRESIHVFTKFFNSQQTLDEITEATVNEYKDWLLFRNLSEVTVTTYLRSIRTVLYFFMDKDYIDRFKMRVPRTSETFKRIYTESEMQKLLRKPNMKKCSFAEYRTWVIVNYVFGTGQRASTIVNLKNEDVDLDGGIVLLRHLKNRKAAVLPLTSALVDTLREYTNIRKGDPESWFFPTVNDTKMAPSTLTHSIADYNRRHGIEKTSIHLMRHTFAVMWVRNSGDIAKLQRMLTHSDLRTTQQYLDLVLDDLQNDMSKNNPLEIFEKQSGKSHKLQL